MCAKQMNGIPKPLLTNLGVGKAGPPMQKLQSNSAQGKNQAEDPVFGWLGGPEDIWVSVLCLKQFLNRECLTGLGGVRPINRGAADRE